MDYFNAFNESPNNYFRLNHCAFNPLDKLVESYEENKKLYERLLKAEQDKIQYLEKLLQGK